MSLAAHALKRELTDPKLIEARHKRLEELEDRVFEHAGQVVEAFMSFHEVDPLQKDPPPEWVERYGEESARKRLAVAKSGWLPQSHSPAAVKVSAQMLVGIARARGQRGKLVPSNINVQVLNLPAPTAKEHSAPEYPTKELE